MDSKAGKKQENQEELPLDGKPTIRAYLDQTVMPLLLEGLADIANKNPNNPIEYLANYLLAHSNEPK